MRFRLKKCSSERSIRIDSRKVIWQSTQSDQACEAGRYSKVLERRHSESDSLKVLLKMCYSKGSTQKALLNKLTCYRSTPGSCSPTEWPSCSSSAHLRTSRASSSRFLHSLTSPLPPCPRSWLRCPVEIGERSMWSGESSMKRDEESGGWRGE